MNREYAKKAHTKKKGRTSRTEKVSAPSIRLLKSAGIGTLAGALLGAVLLPVFAGIAYTQPDPNALIYPLSFGLSAITSLCGGLVAARYSKRPFMQSGAVCAGIWIFLTFLLSQLFQGEPGALSPVYSIAARIMQAVFVLFGAFLGRERPRKAERRRRR